jgi:hypothetical protein
MMVEICTWSRSIDLPAPGILEPAFPLFLEALQRLAKRQELGPESGNAAQ